MSVTEKYSNYSSDLRDVQNSIEGDFENILQVLEKQIPSLLKSKRSAAIPKHQILQYMRAKRVDESLAEYGVIREDFIPPETVSGPSLFNHFLPLEQFEELPAAKRKQLEIHMEETRTGEKTIEALAFVPISPNNTSYEWQNVSAISYNEEEGTWSIAASEAPKHNLVIPGIYLISEGESVREYASRVKQTIIKRNAMEGRVRAEEIASCTPLNYLPEPDQQQVSIICRKIDGKNKDKNKEEATKWMKQLNARLIFHSNFPLIQPKGLSFLKIQDADKKECQSGQEDLRAFQIFPPISKTRDLIKKTWLYPMDECYRSMAGVIFECRQLEEMNFFAVSNFVKLNADVLRTEVENSIATVYWKSNESFEQYKWGDNLHKADYATLHTPLFSVRLIIDNGTIQYDQPLRAFKEVVLENIDFAVLASHDIDQIHPTVLKNLRFPNLKLCSIGLLHPEVQNYRQIIENSLETGIKLLISYLKACERFKDLALLDINEFCAVFLSGNPSVEAFKKEIEGQYAVRTVVEEAIPTRIKIGLFEVNSEEMQTGLLRKQDELTGKLKDALLMRLHDQCMQILDHFSEMEHRLACKMSNIEDVRVTEEWLISVPANIESCQFQLLQIAKGFDILAEDFMYPISEEFATLYWTTRSRPAKIKQKITQCLVQVNEDKEKLFAAFLHDEEQHRATCLELESRIKSFLKNGPDMENEKNAEEVAIWRALEYNLKIEEKLQTRAKMFKFEKPVESNVAKMMKTFRKHFPKSFNN